MTLAGRDKVGVRWMGLRLYVVRPWLEGISPQSFTAIDPMEAKLWTGPVEDARRLRSLMISGGIGAVAAAVEYDETLAVAFASCPEVAAKLVRQVVLALPSSAWKPGKARTGARLVGRSSEGRRQRREPVPGAMAVCSVGEPHRRDAVMIDDRFFQIESAVYAHSIVTGGAAHQALDFDNPYRKKWGVDGGRSMRNQMDSGAWKAANRRHRIERPASRIGSPSIRPRVTGWQRASLLARRWRVEPVMQQAI